MSSTNVMSSQPLKLKFFIGGYMGQSHKVELHGARLLYERFDRGYAPTECRQYVEPTEVQWSEFRLAVDEVGVWNWMERYKAPMGMADGTSWSLAIEYADRRIESSGCNNYPDDDGRPNDSQNSTSAMKKICQALSKLVGGVDIR